MAVFAIVLAVMLAGFGSLGGSRRPVAYGLTGFYASFFRGTPLIVQMFLIYQALPQIGTDVASASPRRRHPHAGRRCRRAIGLGLNYGAYMTEIFRAGIQSVERGAG